MLLGWAVKGMKEELGAGSAFTDCENQAQLITKVACLFGLAVGGGDDSGSLTVDRKKLRCKWLAY